MSSGISTVQACITSNPTSAITPDPFARQVIAELEAKHRAELKRLADVAFVYLNATDNDTIAAERLLDNSLDLLQEPWKYRIVLQRVREGL